MKETEYFLDSQWFNFAWFYCRSDQTEPVAISSDVNEVNIEENLNDQGYIR